MATVLTGIIVDATTGSKEIINDTTEMDYVENGYDPSKYILSTDESWFRKLLFKCTKSIWLKKNRASDNEGKFHSFLMCRMGIYNQKLIS